MQRVLLAVALAALAADTLATGNPQQGRDTAVICIGCHGVDGNSSSSDFPKLAGQGEHYLAKQLRDFKSGARKEQHMTSMVEAISPADIPNIAAWFASQPRTPNGNTAHTDAGKQVYFNGIANSGVSACAGCHGDNGHGLDAAGFPSLAGQHAAYLTRQLMNFRTGSRSNDNQIMQGIAKDLTDKDIESLAGFIATMP